MRDRMPPAAGGWRTLVTSGILNEILDETRERLAGEGFHLLPTVEWPSVARVHELGRDAEVIFGPSVGLDEDLFRSAGGLRVVSMVSSGYDQVDLEAATRAGVVVTNAPGAISEAVADLTFGLIIAAARTIPQRHHRLVAAREADRGMGRLVYRKTLGIVGLGHVGKAVARRARGFDMRVLAVDLDGYWDAAFAGQWGVERAELGELLAASDFVSLHLRPAPATLGIVGAHELAQMKPTAYLINTARASLVDEQALYAALAGGRIAGAGLDTIIDNGLDTPLLGLPNVAGTPHIGGRCIDTAYELVDAAIRNALAVLAGERPDSVVNPEVYDVLARRGPDGGAA